jgi:hypothetical protein
MNRWDPAHMLQLGIAGRVEEAVKLGNVIVGQQIFHHYPQSVKDSGIEYRPEYNLQTEALG